MPTVFQIDVENGPKYTTYDPAQDRIGPLDSKEIEVTFYSTEDMAEPIITEIPIKIRAGKAISIPFKA